MIVAAVDPGNAQSALVTFDTVGRRVGTRLKCPNDEILKLLRSNAVSVQADILVVEMAESFGAKVWSQVFETVFWTGRFVQAWGRPFDRLVRRQVKMHLCNSARAKDAQIRNVLIERWGGKEVAIGKKAAPGPLFGVTADCWQALAIAVTYADRLAETSSCSERYA